LEKIEAVPHIRQHINAIIDLASTEHGIATPSESAALTARVIELRDTPGPDGKIRTWRTIAEMCGTTLDAVRHRYGKGKATIRKSRTVQGLPPVGAPWYSDIAKEWDLGPTGCPIKNERVPTSPEEFQSFEGATAPGAETPITEKPAPIPTRLTMCGDFTTVRGVRLTEKPIDAVGVGVLEEPSGPQTVEKPAPLDPETLAEVDRMLGDGIGVLDIAAELEKKGKLVPWTKIRARAAYLAKMKRKEVAPEPEKADDPEPVAQPGEEPQEVEATEDRPEPVAISRKELDLRMWDLHQTGKTPEEISDILYSKGLHYSPKSVRVRLLSQGAKL
jgi:hypothetical protein